MIKGETVYLLEKREVGRDSMNSPVYEFEQVKVENVLIGNPTFDQIIQEQSLYGKRLAFVLGIPKGDTHTWKDAYILIRGIKFRSYGFPMTQTAENVPGPWNTQVKVELYG